MLGSLLRRSWWSSCLALVVVGCASPAGAVAAAGPSPQPKGGPGGSAAPHAAMTVQAGGRGADAWYVFAPARPRPASAPLVVITHGYYELSGYDTMYQLIRHTVLEGNVVVYPRWQTDVAVPCPGPFDIEPCMKAEVAGIRGALAFLEDHPDHVQAQRERASYLGFSFGGIITANLANRYKSLGLPKPRAIFLDEPHDGGLTGAGEPALDDDLSGIPSSALVQCQLGAGTLPAEGKLGSSCNALFPRLTSIPAQRKDLVMVAGDDHGTPALSAAHGVCAGGPTAATSWGTGSGTADAYDWGFCWKGFDALRSCAYAQVDCRYALGDTPEHRYVGTWSDGTPVVGLKIQDAAPIDPSPVPPRQAAPKTTPPTDAPPRAAITAVIGRGTTSIVRGTARDDHGVAAVQVALVRIGRGGRCAQLTARDTFATLPDCARPTAFRTVAGTRRWAIRLHTPPRAATAYRVVVMPTDTAGRQPARPATRRFAAASAVGT